MNKPVKMGILGGMGPMATSFLFDRIVRHTEAARDQDHIDLVILNRATMPDRTRAILHGEGEEIIRQAEAWGLEPEFLEKTVTRSHIFTHIQWDMTGARLHCGQEGERFIWADKTEIRRQYALPTAFRQFLPDVWEDFS